MGAMQMTEEMRLLLVEILTNTERLDKISVRVDAVSRSITVVYEDLDDEWFREVLELCAHPGAGGDEVVAIPADELLPRGSKLPAGACRTCGGCGAMTTCDRWDPRSSRPCEVCGGSGKAP